MLVLAVAMAWASLPNTLPERPKVEYVAVEGKDCLQPVAHGTDVSLKDYHEAELRWLEAAYPGCRIPRVQNVLGIRPGMQRVLHVSDTITVVIGPGETIDVCFDVNLETPEPEPTSSL